MLKLLDTSAAKTNEMILIELHEISEELARVSVYLKAITVNTEPRVKPKRSWSVWRAGQRFRYRCRDAARAFLDLD